MSTGLKANSDGSAAIQVGGSDVITLTSGGAATFLTSPTTVQAGTAAAPSITFSGDTNTGIYSPGADTVGLTAGGTLVGSVGLGTTLALQGATSQSGIGITFPATQSASSNANTLDDYEEGTFTPTVSGSTVAGTGTYSTQQGTYTKIGNLVTVNVWVQWTAHTGTGNLLFSNLPFASINTTNYRASGSLGLVDVLALTANNVATIALAPNSTNISALQYPVGGGGNTSVAMDTAANIHYSMTYQTST